MKREMLKSGLIFARDVIYELLWPTRCAVCDIAGEEVICTNCINDLKVADEWLACPQCGAPFGIMQCTECNKLMLDSSGLRSLPFDSMSNALVLDEAARRIVSAYKDQDERRLHSFIAKMISARINPKIIDDGYTITYIPDSKEARRRRGFDHSLEIAREVSRLSGLECQSLFKQPSSTDQRKLDRRQRILNMTNRLEAISDIKVPEKVLLIDDVCTTGATIYAACIELKRLGAKKVSVVTFGRVLG